MRLILFFFSLFIFNIAFSEVQITGLQNVQFGAVFAPFTDQSNTISFCVCRQSPLGTETQYNVTVTSANGGSGHFEMTNGEETLAYFVSWSDLLTGGFTTLSSGSLATGFTTIRTTTPVLGGCDTCPLGNTARLRVSVLATALEKAPAGSYTDTLTIVISEP